VALNASREASMLAAQERTSFLRRHAFEWLIGAIIASGVLAGFLISASREQGASSGSVSASPVTAVSHPAIPSASGEKSASIVSADTTAAHRAAAVPTPTSLTEAAARYDAPNSESAEIAVAPDADVRAVVLRDLDGNSPSALPVLEDALRTDPISRNRLLAIKTMRISARNPAQAARVRAALESALEDADENVVTAARDALAEMPR
jgi:hypothetical protein